MALEGPSLKHLAYTRVDEGLDESSHTGSAHSRALRLAREIEELLDDAPPSDGADSTRAAHSARMARAMAASLVDELAALVRSASARRKAGNA